ncbi:M17 family metallopeptidase [Pseudohalocynthiibacter aestuariivivens]|jgi:leucyl aminopeptidase|uniref:M17 family metallopeptidase n=1 Tax=Pseudohalocynthiibacter aestuariivivens TaxID=1591409 RepID=A0ABV5JKB8_9RHOB|nr:MULTISPECIES: leucyl aminopeptidase family protein [Pseudohalocynthiibacter]MBS9715366.1 leucyl aminopeptidase family protein [Pseudohalocynthiibacter aestuariivivens]MCK0102688.1 leucyl aminopeptidase family protein [Pseudohalocynthiibacter sp. F2068]
MPLKFANGDTSSIPVHVVKKDAFKGWLASQPEEVASWLGRTGFEAEAGESQLVPGASGNPQMAVVGYGTAKSRARGRFHIARAARALPKGTYHIASGLIGPALEEAALGWLLASYRFDRYRKQKPQKARLKAPKGVDAARLEVIAEGEALTRDLINTPASDMGPDELESVFLALADQHSASAAIISGDDLLKHNFPMIHAVGRASDRTPRLLDMRWGTAGPMLTLVGKGVCFDTGGLNLKPSSSIGLMKKDMGGAAAALGLAHMIMSLGLRLRLRVLVPAVENSVSGNAFRPQDILTSRKGLTVEINNTDAEGRLVLADALALADEEKPDCLISMATLTGAARVAVGPDLAPYFADDSGFVGALEAAAAQVCDPVWRMPFWSPYENLIEPGIADLDNAPKGGFAGAITAALFLRRFVENSPKYAHFDIYGWQPTAAPARPKGGVGQATRAILEALPSILEI